MKSKFGPMHAIVFIGATVPTSMLLLGLTAPKPYPVATVHRQSVHWAMEPQHHHGPLIHDLINSVISVANSL
ncbi:MAG TPA: hypothetical protein VG267_18095 [Terracidiphilus sp.]|jgi:hypothetical protein|nr:hypothetical protein [Terracidiphilus sp.]